MMTAEDRITEVLRRLDTSQDDARARLFELLRIPSISAQPAHAPDCAAAARWLVHEFAAIGFETALRETPGHPIVTGYYPGPDPATTGATVPHVLFYGHYDVQPADPLELWTSPPFEPQMVEGPHGPRIVARGAVDDKGEVVAFLCACRAWYLATGSLPIRITLLIEGEEEIGGPNLDHFMAEHRAELKADIALISDTNMWDIATPAITTQLRGMVYVQIDLVGPSRDLHSGSYGGAVLNPINALTRILGDLHDAEGHVKIPGFYDGVAEVPPAQAAQWEALGFDEAAMLAGIGLSVGAGELGRSALEKLWARPTADLNGIWGGYTGIGAKTVIASEAHAKLSFRLVPGQNPETVLAGLREFITDRTPPGARITLQEFGGNPGVAVPTEGPFMSAAIAALTDEFGKAPVLMGCGGSIPVVGSLKSLLGLDTILMGFGLEDDQIHSPNEKFEWRCFEGAARSHARLLGKLGAMT
jgi:acetylornithine deacetylase/succinyl-diaminopimelate desuccinylase-like protein